MTGIGRSIAAGMAIAGVSSALVPYAAWGATATTLVRPGHITFEAAPGESNVLSIGREGVTDESAPDSAATAFELSDNPAGVQITPLGDCRAPNGTMTPNYRVFCPVSASLSLNMGDGSDIVQGFTKAPWIVEGGPGGDGITAGDNADVLRGGPGNDTLDGGGNDDDLFGQAGNDVFTDTQGFNDVIAGPGNDSIVDGSGTSDIEAGPGRDLFTDQGGRSDIALMGSGNDRAVVNDGVRGDVVHCGPGDHDKVIVDRDDVWYGDCETRKFG